MMPVEPDLPRSSADAARIARLIGLPRMTHARLASLLAHHSPEEAIAVVGGGLPARGPIAQALKDAEIRDGWTRGLNARPEAWYGEALERHQIRVVLPSDPAYPPQLSDDPGRPAVLFVRGDPVGLDARRVGIVGTRNATNAGRATARRIGRELAEEQVAVISGLALGIDGAAHDGVLAVSEGFPVAVVGSGPDVPYPRRHDSLWDAVAARGLLLSEWPPGTKPDAFRFPRRNRIIAALSEVLVVVESREKGGSLITAREAAERGVDVFAVPGPLSGPASLGTNRLLRDGAAPYTETADVLMALGLDTRRAGSASYDARPKPTGEEARVLDECRSGAVTVDRIALLLGLGVAEAAMALARLERNGWLREVSGWFEFAGDEASSM